MEDIKKATALMLDAFYQFLMDTREIDTFDPDDVPGAFGDNRQELDPPAPFLFPDEISAMLRDAGSGAEVRIFDLFPDASEYTYPGGYDRDLTMRIYDAIEAGYPVWINGEEIYPGSDRA